MLALCVVATVACGVAAVDGASGASGASESGPESENRTLVVADAESETRLFAVPVRDGDEVVLSYTHSVEKSTVEDVYVVEGTDLRMDRTVFASFGAGLPSEADATLTEDGFVVSVDRTYERVYVSTGRIAGHELVVGDRRYDLVERSNASTVTLSVEERADVTHPDDRSRAGGACP